MLMIYIPEHKLTFIYLWNCTDSEGCTNTHIYNIKPCQMKDKKVNVFSLR